MSSRKPAIGEKIQKFRKGHPGLNLRAIERRIIVASRFLTVLAVVGSLVSSVLMLSLGIYDVYEAFRHGLNEPPPSDKAPFGTTAVINVIQSLDRFLIAIVLLYFAYGVYSLFIHPEEAEEKLALPAWLRVGQVGQLKQVVAELILVILFVLFLRVALQSFGDLSFAMSWEQIATIMSLPVSIALLALALRLVELHPKPFKPTNTSGGTGLRSGSDPKSVGRK